jgi:hypothetical protein
MPPEWTMQAGNLDAARVSPTAMQSEADLLSIRIDETEIDIGSSEGRFARERCRAKKFTAECAEIAERKVNLQIYRCITSAFSAISAVNSFQEKSRRRGEKADAVAESELLI